jgi:hypothetical protein
MNHAMQSFGEEREEQNTPLNVFNHPIASTPKPSSETAEIGSVVGDFGGTHNFNL